jgi:hypothetical protein
MLEYMPFCTSCGSEVPADKKFCVECGAPMESSTTPAPAPVTPMVTGVPVHPSAPLWTPPAPPKKPRTLLIIGAVVAVLVILAAAYVVGLPMIKASQKSPEVIPPTITFTPTPLPTVMPTEEETMEVMETPDLPVQVRDERLEADYEEIYSLNQSFAFGQKVNFVHELTRAPLYVRFNLTPTTIVRHRLVSIGTNNEHFENTTENSPYSWFEIRVLDAVSGGVITEQGFGNDYSDETRQKFMVRKNGNYRIEMSGNDVTADIQLLIGTP